ncbi:hypothetical protein T484DRAFT_1742590 [Baffinella frigidus]|nr:hypothetical protein T484DRAFT_1742590 [Cryptophyta sp. CCMP2293]
MRGFGSLATPGPPKAAAGSKRLMDADADEVAAPGSGGKRSRGFGSLVYEAPGAGAAAQNSRGGQGFGSLSSTSLRVSVPSGNAQRTVRKGGAPGAAPAPDAPVSAGRRAEGVRGRGTTSYGVTAEIDQREVPQMPEERRTKLLKVRVPPPGPPPDPSAAHPPPSWRILTLAKTPHEKLGRRVPYTEHARVQAFPGVVRWAEGKRVGGLALRGGGAMQWSLCAIGGTILMLCAPGTISLAEPGPCPGNLLPVDRRDPRRELPNSSL